MATDPLRGHERIARILAQSLRAGRLASTYLFVGPPGIGKHAFALRLAQSLLCETRDPAELDPCGQCPGCIQAMAGTHPDLHLVAKPRDRSFIPLSCFLGDDQHRLREGLCHWISLKPSRGRRKVAIVDDADALNEEGANCLLKTLEEPPPCSLLILVGTSALQQLPTIRSRSQIIRFAPLEIEDVREVLLERGIATDPHHAQRLAERSQGSLAAAIDLADEELEAFRAQLVSRLASGRLDSVKTAAWVAAFIDDAGKEAPTRRRRARSTVGFALEFYRALLRALSARPMLEDTELAAAVARAAIASPPVEAVLACIDRCLETLDHIDRNANQATLIDAWIDDLASIMAGLPVAA